MGDPLIFRLWIGRALFFVFVFCVMFIKLLPLDSVPGRFPGPDLLMALTFAWISRRPEHVPFLSVVIVFFLNDMIFLKPPGLWTLIVLGASEFLRSNTFLTRDMPLLAEWGVVAVVMIMAMACEQLMLVLFILPNAGLGPSLFQIFATILVYPAMVLALKYGLGLHHVTANELYDTGRRL